MSAMMAKLRAGIAYDVIFPSAEYAQRLIEGNLIRKIDRDKLKNVDTVYPHFDDPWYDPGSEHTTPYGMYATGLGYRADKVTGMTGLLARPRRGRLGRQELPARRLPGGHRHGQPGERLPAQRGRPREARAVEGLPGRPEAEAARHLRGHDHEHGERQRLHPAPLERRHREHPLPGRQPRGLQVPEVQGGPPGRQRRLRDPRQREASRDRADVHRVHARARERGAERGVDRLPDALRGRRHRGLPGARQGRPRDQPHRRGSRQRPAVREPEGRGRLAWDEVWTEFKVS